MTTTTNYGWLIPDVGSTGWGPDLNTFLADLDDRLFHRLTLQASTPGTAQTGHANISGTLKAGVLSAGTSIDAATTITAGTGLIATTGGVTATTGGVTASAGNIVATLGNIVATAGSLSAGSTLAAATNVALNTSSGNTNIGAALGTSGGKLNVWDSAEQLRLIYSAGVYAGFTVDSSGHLTIGTTGGVISPDASGAVRSPTYTSGVAGWNIGGAGDAEFNNVTLRGALRTSVFTYAELAATAGTLGVFYSAATLKAACTTPASLSSSFTFDARNTDAGAMLLAVNDRVRLKTWTGSGISDSWATVTARTDHSTYATYTATLTSGSTSATFPAGTGIADYGPSGASNITLSADGTVGSSPNITLTTHAGSPWSAQTTLARLGNLNGAYAYVADTYGLGLGQYGASAQTWLTFDTTNGIRIGNNTIVVAQWAANGNVTVGQVGSGLSNVLISSGAVKLRNNTTDVISLLASADAQGYLANFTQPIEVQNGFGAFANNSGTFASPSGASCNGSKLWNNGTSGFTFDSFSGGVQKLRIATSIFEWWNTTLTTGMVWYSGAGSGLLGQCGLGYDGSLTTTSLLSAVGVGSNSSVGITRLSVTGNNSSGTSQNAEFNIRAGGSSSYAYVNGTGATWTGMTVNATTAPSTGYAFDVNGSAVVRTALKVGATAAVTSGYVADFVGNLYLGNATNPRLSFGASGAAAPAFTSPSAGEKLTLYTLIDGSTANYALGVESGSLWMTVPLTSSTFKLYGGTTLAWTLNGNGNGTCVGTLTQSSDRRLKTGIVPATDADEGRLAVALAGLPLSVWEPIADPGKRRFGPMAQDWQTVCQVLGLDTDGTGINISDALGVLFATVKVLGRRVRALELARP